MLVFFHQVLNFTTLGEILLIHRKNVILPKFQLICTLKVVFLIIFFLLSSKLLINHLILKNNKNIIKEEIVCGATSIILFVLTDMFQHRPCSHA